MQTLRFASTKIQPPRLRSTQLPRPALDTAVLAALRQHRVLLLQAPAGFGKTSVLAALVAPHSAGLATAWVSLDPDDDAERLFACLVAALEPHDLPWRTLPDALVDLTGADGAGMRRAVTELVNALAGSDVAQGVIVLDDLHRVQAPSAFALLDTLVQQLPPRWAVVLASRTAPPLPLARWRANGELAEFDQEALRFKREEAAALLQRQRERLADELPELLRRAAAGEEDTPRKVGFLLRAQDWRAAEAALLERSSDLLLRGGAGDVLRLIEQFPPEQRSARLCCVAGSACVLRWQWAEMAAWLERALHAPGIENDPATRGLVQARLALALYPLDRNAEAEALITELHQQTLTPEARASLLLADGMQHFRRNPHSRLPLLFGELLEILERGAPLLLWWELAPPVNWATIDGMAPLLARYLAGAELRLNDQPLPMRAQLRLLQGVLWLWAGRLDDAEDAVRSAEDDIRWLAVSGETQVSVNLFRAIHAAMYGRAEQMTQRLELLLTLEEDAEPERRSLWQHQMAVYGVRLSDTLGDVQGLQHWAGLLRENPLVNPVPQNSRAIAVRARFAAAQERWADAVALFEQLSDVLPGMDVMGQRTDLTLRWGHALLRLNRVADAARLIAPVLDRVQNGGAGQPLLCGPVLLQTLADARWGALLTLAQRNTLVAAAQLSASLRGAPPAPAPAKEGALDKHGLSAREREVLESIAAGHSNKLIARELDISPHTVKRHVANILDKLGLSSRGQASAWLHTHG